MTDKNSLSPHTVAAIQNVMGLARRGDLAGARRAGEAMIARGTDIPVFQSLLGLVHCQAGDAETGVRFLRPAAKALPADVAVTANLVTALMDISEFEEALSVCTGEAAARDPSPRTWRLRAFLLQHAQDYVAAIEAYRIVVARAPDDFEAWNNLGNACSALSDASGAVEALERAVQLRSDVAPARVNLAAAQLEAGDAEQAMTTLKACAADFPDDAKPLIEMAAIFKLQGRDDEALDAFERAALLVPDDYELLLQLGGARSACWKMDEAELAFRQAIALDPGNGEAFLLLGNLLDLANRPEDFDGLIAEADANAIEPGSLAFVRAMAMRRENRFAEGLEQLNQVTGDLEPIRREQLRGQFLDRLGDHDQAFAAFEEMNRLQSLDPSQPLVRAAQFRDQLAAERDIVTPDWVKSWSVTVADTSRQSPAFLVGFPRSGTTLLDTMLMGHPDVQVMEERPPLTRVSQKLGDIGRLPGLTEGEVDALRDVYWEEAANWVTPRTGALLVDKFPLHMNRVPLIQRLFPDARFILALRHPCDVVLSCFMTNFRINNAMVNFLELQTNADVYDSSFRYWEQACALFSVQTHSVIYEEMIVDSAGVLRPLFEWLGLDWREQVLDHRETAANRGLITTASYAQVTEPLYTRAAGRWEKYRAHLEPILPVLQPWIERFGYA